MNMLNLPDPPMLSRQYFRFISLYSIAATTTKKRQKQNNERHFSHLQLSASTFEFGKERNETFRRMFICSNDFRKKPNFEKVSLIQIINEIT